MQHRMLEIAQTNLFKRQLKKCRKRGWDVSELEEVVALLQQQKELPAKYRDHALSGDRAGQRDCHIKSDWILIYAVRENVLILQLLATGSHADLDL